MNMTEFHQPTGFLSFVEKLTTISIHQCDDGCRTQSCHAFPVGPLSVSIHIHLAHLSHPTPTSTHPKSPDDPCWPPDVFRAPRSSCGHATPLLRAVVMWCFSEPLPPWKTKKRGWRRRSGGEKKRGNGDSEGLRYTILFGMHNHAKFCEATASTKYFKERKHNLTDQTYSKFYSPRLFFTVLSKPFYLQTLNIPVQHKCVELLWQFCISSSVFQWHLKEARKIAALWHLAGARLLFCIGLKLSEQLRAKDDVSSLMETSSGWLSHPVVSQQ